MHYTMCLKNHFFFAIAVIFFNADKAHTYFFHSEPAQIVITLLSRYFSGFILRQAFLMSVTALPFYAALWGYAALCFVGPFIDAKNKKTLYRQTALNSYGSTISVDIRKCKCYCEVAQVCICVWRLCWGLWNSARVHSRLR